MAPAGLVATRHPGGIGAPPGTTRSPCQELADRPAIVGNGKRGPVLQKTPQIACPIASLLERMWRAERRPPSPETEVDIRRATPLMI